MQKQQINPAPFGQLSNGKQLSNGDQNALPKRCGVKYLEIRKKYQDFLLWLFQKINTFPKKQKFIIGEEIGKLSLKILKDIIILQYTPANERRNKIKAFNLELDVFRSLMRLVYEMKFLSHKSFLYQESKVNETGRMVYGLAMNK